MNVLFYNWINFFSLTSVKNDRHFLKCIIQLLCENWPKLLAVFRPGWRWRVITLQRKEVSTNFKNSEVAPDLGYLRAKLVLSNPPTQRKVKLCVKRFIEILVDRKTEFFYSKIHVAYILLYCKTFILVTQIILQIAKIPENDREITV